MWAAQLGDTAALLRTAHHPAQMFLARVMNGNYGSFDPRQWQSSWQMTMADGSPLKPSNRPVHACRGTGSAAAAAAGTGRPAACAKAPSLLLPLLAVPTTTLMLCRPSRYCAQLPCAERDASRKAYAATWSAHVVWDTTAPRLPLQPTNVTEAEDPFYFWRAAGLGASVFA